MSFEIVDDRLTFWLDRTNEIPEWSIEHIKSRRKEVENELKQLFENEMKLSIKEAKRQFDLSIKGDQKFDSLNILKGFE